MFFLILWLQAATSTCKPTEPGVTVTIVAQAVDTTYMPLPGVSVVAQSHEKTDKQYQGTTDRFGFACLSTPEDGVYSLEAKLVGFRKGRLDRIDINGTPGSPQYVQLSLQVIAIE